jgi:hypothetical protein
MMKSTILMTSVAVAALTSPAFALPDRLENGCSMSNAICAQEQLRTDDGSRVAERANASTESGSGASVGTNGALTANAAAARDDDSLSDEAGDTADHFAHDANETGDSIANAADEAGDSISNAADEAGDAISDAFN